MILSDVSHYIGTDLATSATGDLAPVLATVRGQQRILRRLLTNPGDYIFHPDYGAGLPSWVGRTADLPALKSLILSQMLLEASVATDPAPLIDVQPIPSSAGGGFAVSIQYADAGTGETVTLSFDVTR